MRRPALEPALADTYYANFSVFQSAPDAWAIDSMVRLLPTTYQRIVTGVVRSRRGKG